MKVLRMNFTLVELLTVIAVIAILAGIAVPVIVGASAKGKETTARADMNAIKLALTQFKADYSVWPVLPATGDTMLPAAYTSGETGNRDSDIDNMISELTTIQGTPASNAPQSVTTYTYNSRRRKYLDAPARPVQPFGTGTAGFYKLDPWGRRYNIALDTDYNKQLVLTTTFLANAPTAETIVGEIAIYSYGTAEDKGDTDAFLYSWKTLAR